MSIEEATEGVLDAEIQTEMIDDMIRWSDANSDLNAEIVSSPGADIPPQVVVAEEPKHEEPPVLEPETVVTTPSPQEPAATPVQEAPPNEFEEMKAQNAALIEQLNMMARGTMVAPEVPQAEAKAKASEGLQTFITDENFDEFVGSAAGLNKLLQAVYAKAVEDTTLRIAPMTSHIVTQQIHLQRMTDDFYKANEDLTPFREYVGFVANKISADHPDWSYEKIFSELAPTVRGTIKMSQKVGPAPVAQRRAPAFAAAPASRPPAGGSPQKQGQGLEKELSEFLHQLNNDEEE